MHAHRHIYLPCVHVELILPRVHLSLQVTTPIERAFFHFEQIASNRSKAHAHIHEKTNMHNLLYTTLKCN